MPKSVVIASEKSRTASGPPAAAEYDQLSSPCVRYPTSTTAVRPAGMAKAALASVESGGVLLYQTFMEGNERFGRPSRPEFLLKDGELLELVRGSFPVIAYEARLISEPAMAMVQRIAARRL